MSSRLDAILDSTRLRIEALQGSRRELEAAAGDAPPARDFGAALRRPDKASKQAEELRVIAELKRRSPSAGAIREDLDPINAARQLEAAGAAVLSVLTEPEFFGGSLEFLEAVRDSVDLPLLRKDFILDPLQVVEARARGADAILLLAAALNDDEIRALHDEARRWSLQVLAEAHDARELERLLALEMPIIGVNARDLRSFEVDLPGALELCSTVPIERIVVAESGVRVRADAELVAASSVDATLCGEGLMRGGQPGERFAELFGNLQGRSKP